MLALVSGCAIGLVNGMRHALEPDHLAAVSTFVAGRRRTGDVIRLATSWGLGHAVTLLLAGGLLFALRTDLSPTWSTRLELVVAATLVVLGLRGLYVASRLGGQGPAHMHRHGAVLHTHDGAADHVHVAGARLARIPFAVGIVHGLAGSGGITALVAAHLPTLEWGALFLALYAAGSVVGMALLGGVLGVPLAWLARSERGSRMLVFASACLSVIVGVLWAIPLIFA
jgi:hypothetical protein